MKTISIAIAAALIGLGFSLAAKSVKKPSKILPPRSTVIRQKPSPAAFDTQMKSEEVSEIPPIRSKIKGIEVTGAYIDRVGTRDAALMIEVTNNTDFAVMCINFFTESTDKRDSAGPHSDGFMDEGPHKVIIAPHGLREFRWHVSVLLNLQFPIEITAVVFMNQAGELIEEGDPYFIKYYRDERPKARKRHDEESKSKEVQP